MVFPLPLTLRLSAYIMKNRLQGVKRFPLVLMLEPLFLCNLNCLGCGRIKEFRSIADQTLSAEECLKAVKECPAPVVSITGGEPLLHPQIGEIAAGIVAQKRFVYLCTNALLLEESLEKFRPSSYFSFVVHLDGLEATHDRITGRKGTFAAALGGIKKALKMGFQVRTNTTIYKESDLEEVKGLFRLLTRLGIDGVMLSPGFSFTSVDGDVFLEKEEAHRAFRSLYNLWPQVKFYNSPIYLQFLSGQRELQCTPWANPTRNPQGWKQPCYLLTDGYAPSYQDLMATTSWEKYGVGREPRCANCMVHSGFEGSALAAAGNPRDLWTMVRWNFFS